MRNNNFSVLPFYKQGETINSQKWWAYGRIYPLYSPKSLLPFQVIVDKERASVEESAPIDITQNAAINKQGQIILGTNTIAKYELANFDEEVFSVDVEGNGVPGITVAFYDSDNTFIKVGVGYRTYEIPEEAAYVALVFANIQGDTTRTWWSKEKSVTFDSDVFLLDEEGEQIRRLILVPALYEYGDDKVVIVYDGSGVIGSVPIGRARLKFTINGFVDYISDIFTIVERPQDMLKIQWWDDEDFVMDAGEIIYQRRFKNEVYLCASVAKPDYKFDEEVIERDGYTFPLKQISEKIYHFSFMAPEYLLDVMRFVRLADYIKITYGEGEDRREVNVDSFLMTPSWQGDGDIANVDVEFHTDTIAKKIGQAYIKNQ